MSGKDFWFRNATTCKRFCRRNGINLKHWKRTEEARTHKLRSLINIQNDQNNEEDRTEQMCMTDVDLETEGGPLEAF